MLLIFTWVEQLLIGGLTYFSVSTCFNQICHADPQSRADLSDGGLNHQVEAVLLMLQSAPEFGTTVARVFLKALRN
jgi:hypothetical protein